MSERPPHDTDRTVQDEHCQTSKCIDWFHEGETKVVEVDGVRITVRFIGRKGRRGRIAIEAPPAARFLTLDPNVITGAPGRSNQR